MIEFPHMVLNAVEIAHNSPYFGVVSEGVLYSLLAPPSAMTMFLQVRKPFSTQLGLRTLLTITTASICAF